MSTPDTRSTPYAKALRSSCRYCRRRKIKCDGNSPCGACQSRRMDCVHDERAKMGRPLKSAVGSPADEADEFDGIEVAALAEAAFLDAFRSAVPTTAFSAALHSYMKQREVDLSMLMDEHAIAEQKACEPDVYDALFPVLFVELLDTLRFHYNVNEGRRRPTFLPLSLRIDPTAQMYDGFKGTPTPYVDTDDEAIVRDCFALWADNHPFAACITVDALQHRDSAASRAIRQLVLLEARQMRGHQRDPIQISGQYAYAETLFAQQRIAMSSDRLTDDAQVAATLLACQAALLFSWHELAHTHAKRGITYMAVAGQLMGQAQAAANSAASLTPSTQAAMHLVSSFLSLATVWAFSQLDRSTGSVDGGHAEASTSARPHRAVLMNAAARLSALLLNSHPAVVSSADTPLDDKSANVSSLALRLYPIVNTMQLVLPGDAVGAHTLDLVEGYRDAVQLMLLRCASTANRRSANDAALLSILHNAQARIVRLAGPLPAAPSQTAVLAKLAYDRRPASANREEDPDAGLKKTMAAYLFTSLASTAEQRWDGSGEGDDDVAVCQAWRQACATLSTASFDLLDTPTLQQARQTFHRCGASLEERGTPNTNSSSSANASPPTAATSIFDDTETPIKLPDGADEDVYSMLWGFVPWTEYEDAETIGMH